MKLYDTLSGTKKELTPTDGEVKMYVCGPNLYGPSHVGHALSYVVFDVLRRYLEYRGYRVRHVQNFTDIEDRIIELGITGGMDIKEVAKEYIERFLVEMDGLGLQRAHHYPRATEYIDQMIEIIQGLIAKGHAYAVDGDVYYQVTSFPTYGRLSNRSMDEMKTGTRIEADPRKKDPMDFALWKASKEGEPTWPSPWGQGRPGWHIECSAMSTSLLGPQLDIHGGGLDVVFPHHENEIAQSEGFTGASPFAQFWVHNGLLHPTEDAEEKMTRHEGNFVSIRDTLARHHRDAIRLFLLSSHYRSPRAYSEEEIESQARAAERMRSALREGNVENGSPLEVDSYRKQFIDAMDDDLNTSRAIAVLFDLAREINRSRGTDKDIRSGQEMLRELSDVLGLSFDEPESSAGIAAQPFIDLLIQVRTQLRQERQFALSDTVRDGLEGLGVILEDSPDGTTWRLRQTDTS
jgi:cysteinyl-tRNA synthetase